MMFWPQVIRGAAIMFCLLPPTRLALGHLDASRVPNASGLFNLMRNLGGAIGLAMIDTVIYSRSPVLGAAIMTRLQAGDSDTARFIGIPANLFAARPPGPLDDATRAMLNPLVESAALVQAINEAWIVIAVLTLIALLCVPFAKKSPNVFRAAAPNSRRHARKSIGVRAHRSSQWRDPRPRPDSSESAQPRLSQSVGQAPVSSRLPARSAAQPRL